MNLELLNFLVDPVDRKSSLEVIDIRQEIGSEIIEATLRSQKGNFYPVINGIPRLLFPDLLVSLAPVSRMWLAKYIFNKDSGQNKHSLQVEVAKSFQAEWKKFPHFIKDYEGLYESYFSLWKDKASFGEYVLDGGCGMGRWAKFASRKTKNFFCVDISEAIDVAKEYLKEEKNIFFIQSDLVNLPFRDSFFDSIYSLGVLHHIPDTQKALLECSSSNPRASARGRMDDEAEPALAGEARNIMA